MKLLYVIAAGAGLALTLNSCSIIQGSKYFQSSPHGVTTTKTTPAQPVKPVADAAPAQTAKPAEPVRTAKPAATAQTAKPATADNSKNVVANNKADNNKVVNNTAVNEKTDNKADNNKADNNRSGNKKKGKKGKGGKGKAAKTEPAGTLVPESEIAKAVAGEWAITAAGTMKISRDEDMPYICFVPDENRFYGSDGCNVLNGIYTVEGKTMTFRNVLATMRYCPGNDFEQKINAVVCDDNVVTLTMTRHKDRMVLDFRDSAGHKVLTLTRHNMDFINGYWFVKTVYGKSVKDEEANIFIDVNEQKIHGNTGCNYFNGNIHIDAANPGNIGFSGMAVTHMACDKGDQERNMLLALEDTASAKDAGDGTVKLYDHHGREVIVLQRGDVPGMGR